MPSTRSSARVTENKSSPPASIDNKRKADESQNSPSKRGRINTSDQNQTTLEDFIDTDEKQLEKDIDADMKDDKTLEPGESFRGKTKEGEDKSDPEKALKDSRNGQGLNTLDTHKPQDDKVLKPGESFRGKTKEGEDKSDPEKALKDSRNGQGLNTLDVHKPQVDIPHDDVHADFAAKEAAKDTPAKDAPAKDAPAKDPEQANKDGAVSESKERQDQMPSNILEKGIIYFFTRGRVGIDDPQEVQDLQRSYFVLRPLPKGAKIGHGSMEDLKNNRIIALPKKVFPVTPSDKFMVFVEKAKTSIDDLKENFFQGSEHETKTVGTRKTPPMSPVGEGVYAITTTGGRSESHLAYMLTIPREPGELQTDLGIRTKGSFVMSLKNPTVKGPSYATLDQSPEFPQDVIDEFSNRSWMPAQPKHLDFANAQFLLIGESLDDGHALEPSSKDKKSGDKETPQEEIEKLEHEDELRVEGLKGDDTVFEDLGLSHKEYHSVVSTW